MKRFLLVNRHSYSKKLLPARVSASGFFTFPLNLLVLKKSLLIITVLLSINIYGQENNDKQQSDYKKAIKERSAKIVNTLGIPDSGKYNVVLNELMNQYFSLNKIHEQSKTAIAEIKQKSKSKEETEEALKEQEEKKSSLLLQQHATFIAHLKESLTEDQLDKVKDGMTYRVFPITYAGYQDMLTNLTAEQKNKIYTWLKEARELAMDEGSSEKKHQVFGKYKGKINNYLSKAGYDLKKESKAWQERIKAREAVKN
ncbi:MAG TPA: DUF3826 domain-containing protein [Chitinophagaceae bacterium]|nr:DUF3826 domain-containing protein [Chitinophagaceae bacterium]